MNYLWPYKSSPGKRKHWFKQGKKELLVTIRRRKGKTFVKANGSLEGNFTFLMPLDFTMNNEEVIFE